MKDIIGAVSGLVALIVVISCIINGHSLESTLLKTFVSFFVSNIIGYAALGLSVITMYKDNSVEGPEMPSNETTNEVSSNA